MKLEEFIKNNKEGLEWKVDMDDVWNNISESTKRQRFTNKKYISLAVLVLLLVLAFKAYQILSNKSQSNVIDNEQMHFAYQPTSTSARLLEVNRVSNIETGVDGEVAGVMLELIKNDPSVNVKIAATRALKDYMHLEEVRVQIISQISETDHSYLKISLIKLLRHSHNKTVIPSLDSILDKQQPSPLIMNEWTNVKEKLLNI